MKPDYSLYDAVFNEWLEKVRTISEATITLESFFLEVSRFDPYGCFDADVSPEAFSSIIKEEKMS
jgi:hypothetical protein